MTSATIWELIGYFGSILILVSMFMTSIYKLRLVNTIGSFIFCIYAIVIGSYPTAFLNGALVAVNIYNIYKLTKIDKEFDLLEVNPDDITLYHFLKIMMPDIVKYFPDFSLNTEFDKAYMIYQKNHIAGVCLGNLRAETSMDFCLDYSSPDYRDFSVGNYVYKRFAEFGYHYIYFSNPSKGHVDYLKKMGYKETGDNTYKKEL